MTLVSPAPLSDTGMLQHDADDMITIERVRPVISRDADVSSFLEQSAKAVSTGVYANTIRPRKLFLPPPKRSEPLDVLKHWEGVVQNVEGSTVYAAMRDRASSRPLPTDEFEFDIDDVAEGDRALVREGAIFYITVGVRRPKGETPQKTTVIVFRRMPQWSKGDLARGERAGEDLWQQLQEAERISGGNEIIRGSSHGEASTSGGRT